MIPINSETNLSFADAAGASHTADAAAAAAAATQVAYDTQLQLPLNHDSFCHFVAPQMTMQ